MTINRLATFFTTNGGLVAESDCCRIAACRRVSRVSRTGAGTSGRSNRDRSKASGRLRDRARNRRRCDRSVEPARALHRAAGTLRAIGRTRR